MTVLKRGYLYKLPRSGMFKHWNKRWVVLHSSSKEGNLRMEYYDTEGHETREVQRRIIPLDGCHAVSQIAAIKSKKYVFDFTTKLAKLVFATDTKDELDDWIKSIKTAVQFDLELRKRNKLGISLKDQTSSTSVGSQVEVENAIYEPSLCRDYEVLVEVNETSERLNLEGKYLLVVSMEGVKLVDPDSKAVAVQWEYRHLKKYGKSTGKFNLECGRASKCGAGVFAFVTNEGRQIFGHIHQNVQLLGSKREASETEASPRSTSLYLSSTSQGQGLPKGPHEAPAAIGTNSAPVYAVVDKSKKKKKSSFIAHGNQDSGIATTTGVKAGVFRKLDDEHVYDAPLLSSIRPKQAATVNATSSDGNEPQYACADAKSDTKQQATSASKAKSTITGNIGYSIPFDAKTSTKKQPAKTLPLASTQNPFGDDFAVSNEPVQWQESKLAQPTATEKVVEGDYCVPPEPDDMSPFTNDPFADSGEVHFSPLGTKQDYVNDPPHIPTASYSGKIMETSLSFESDDDDDAAVVNPLLDVADFGTYLESGGDDHMWADLLKPKFK